MPKLRPVKMILQALTETMRAKPKQLLGIVTAVYVISFLLPVLPPSQKQLDFDPHPVGASALELAVWLTRLLLFVPSEGGELCSAEGSCSRTSELWRRG
jgi:hypothetical protein